MQDWYTFYGSYRNGRSMYCGIAAQGSSAQDAADKVRASMVRHGIPGPHEILTASGPRTKPRIDTWGEDSPLLAVSLDTYGPSIYASLEG